MKNIFAIVASAALTSVMCADEFADIPWLGDGRPDPTNSAAFYAEDPAPRFEASFVLPQGSASTGFEMACAGFYVFELNGRSFGPGGGAGIAPLWSPFDSTIYADRIAPPAEAFLPWPATNVIAVTLGNGFYNLPPLLFWGSRNFRAELAHGRPCFKLRADCRNVPLTWTWRETQVVRNCVYLGAHEDRARLSTQVRPAVKMKGPRGRIVPRRAPPTVQIGAPLIGKSSWIKPGVQMVDFGVNASGCPSFAFKGQSKGKRIEIVYGERLNADGSVNVLTQTAGQIKAPGCGGPGAPDIACQRDVFVCGGAAVESFSPLFTWHICRYAEVRGYDRLLGDGDAILKPISSSLADAQTARDFKTDDPDFARLHEICRRTFLANMIGGVQSDCPGRERLGYGGDIVATCEAFVLNWDMREFYLKTLQDFADEAAAGDGWITETAPYVGIAAGDYGPRRAGPISWSLAVPVMMDALIRHYPDVKARSLAFYPVCARYLRLLNATFPDGIVPRCIGDHEALERAPNDVVATAHAYEFARLTVKFAKMLGRDWDVREFSVVADKMKSAFAGRFVKGGVVANGTQSAQALGLYLGLVPVEQIPAAEKALVAAVEAKGCAPTTGIFTTRYMLMYLSEHGRLDLAERIVRHRGFPGWMHMLDRGATTLWETWKESDNVYSNCHPMFGSVDEWLLRFESNVR